MNSHKNEDYSLLIIDDEPINIQLLGNLLNENNYEVEFATSGREALEWTASRPFDMILLDVMMPEMDGFEVCKKLKASPKTKNIPIIFLTAKTDTKDIIKGFEVGGVDYILKPFNTSELIHRIDIHLELQHNRQELIKQNEIQRELLHVLSHDLSNSLGGILGFSKNIQRYPEKSNQLMDYIINNAENALEIINLSKKLLVAEGKLLNTSSLYLKRMLDQSTLFLHSKLKAKSILLEISILEHIKIIAEEISLINSVLINLLSNAIKFSPKGSTIKIDSKQDEDEGKVKVIISDSGLGIPRQMVNDIFDLSKCTSRPGTEGEEGTGFGMALVKKFMHKYGGAIMVSSKSIENFPDDHGTEITLIFKVGK